MFDLFMLGVFFLVPTLVGAALGFWRWGRTLAFGLAAVALAVGTFMLVQGPPPGSDRLGHVVFTNLMFVIAGELTGGWALAALTRWLWRRRKA